MLRLLGMTLLLGALALGACGGGSAGSGGQSGASCLTATGDATSCVSGQPPGSILVTDYEYKFDPSTVTAKAGKIILYEINKGSIVHSIEISDMNDKQLTDGEDIEAGGNTTITADLPAGTYQLICDIPGHKGQGMVGQLVIT
jgi:uncharacterized cupredoxin-like copper-binding protein